MIDVMKRINVFLDIKQLKFLESQSGTISEHIRRAVEDYIKAIQLKSVSASKSVKESD